jgi:hypothetical protein
MTIVNNKFWRLEPAPGTDPDTTFESRVLTSPAMMMAKIRRLDGIVVGTWDPDTKQGKVHALGIVKEVDGKSAVVDWRRSCFNVRPSGPGATQWKKRTFFEFVDLVAARYGLMDKFHGAFTTNNSDVGNLQRPVDESPAVPSATSHRLPVTADAAAITKSLAPQSNRVAPNGEIFATPERGMFMGNRTSPPRWLVCDLHFKRCLKEERKYTKLFFLDEAVALAAGHRPCNTCRRYRYQTYLAAVRTDLDVSGAAELDALLNTVRRTPYVRTPIASLPDGAFVDLGEDDYWLKWSGALHRWTPAGYVESVTLARLEIDDAIVLTPEPSLAALRNGYLAEVHASATKR